MIDILYYFDLVAVICIKFLLPLLLIYVLFLFLQKKVFNVSKKKKLLQEASKHSAKGVIFGKSKSKVIYSPSSDEGHIAVFGGSGVGKTSAILIPTLRSWSGTSFTIDISGDICKNVHMPNKIVYEPENSNTLPYDIFHAIDQIDNEFKQNEMLEQLSFLLMPDSEKFSDASAFYNTEGRKILTASLIAFYHQGKDFIDICKIVFSNSWKDLFNQIDNTNCLEAIQYINSFEGASEQNNAGCKQACDASIKLFATNYTIQNTIRRPKEDERYFAPNVLENNNVFIVIQDSKLKLFSPLLHIITAQSLEFFSERSNDNSTTILFCLDEFASLGKMEITDALRKLRKKHVRIMMLTQSMADIDLIYGKSERMAMMNNFSFKVILEASDTETQDYFAKLIGYQPTKKRSVSTNSHTTTKTLSEDKEWIIEPSDLARLGDNLILLYRDGYKQLQKNFYFK